MTSAYLKQLIEEIREQSAKYKANLKVVKSNTSVFKQNLYQLHRDYLQAENRFAELVTGVQYDTPVMSINPAQQELKQTGSY